MSSTIYCLTWSPQNAYSADLRRKVIEPFREESECGQLVMGWTWSTHSTFPIPWFSASGRGRPEATPQPALKLGRVEPLSYISG